jgi:RecA/RadA recombinase
MTVSLLEKLKKNSKLSGTDVLSESEFFTTSKPISTTVPMINVALSGEIDGGLTCGHTMLAGPSKHFKTSFALLMAAAYLEKYDDGVLMFYDTEFGSPQDYFKSFGIDPQRVLHTPVMNIEQLKFDLVNQLDQMDKKDRVIIVIDSIGNIASKKEIDDALSESSKADMTRAKALKSLFRMITPYLKTKDIPLITINHIYMEQGMFPKAIVSGGTGGYLSADNIWIVGRQQDKIGTEIQGYHFVINIEKSRFLREKSKIPISVTWEKGISRWSGLLEVALESGFVKKPKNGWYALWDVENDQQIGKSLRAAETQTSEFWTPLLKNKEFESWIRNRYKISTQQMIEGNTNND